jgi:hypothetical protein
VCVRECMSGQYETEATMPMNNDNELTSSVERTTPGMVQSSMADTDAKSWTFIVVVVDC